MASSPVSLLTDKTLLAESDSTAPFESITLPESFNIPIALPEPRNSATNYTNETIMADPVFTPEQQAWIEDLMQSRLSRTPTTVNNLPPTSLPLSTSGNQAPHPSTSIAHQANTQATSIAERLAALERAMSTHTVPPLLSPTVTASTVPSSVALAPILTTSTGKLAHLYI